MLCGASGLAFAIGVYLPLASMAALYVGGCVRKIAERSAGASRAADGDPGVLAARAWWPGEGLAGVLVAGLVASGDRVPGRWRRILGGPSPGGPPSRW